jgi:CRP-like cAMP-binding protein
VSDDALGRAYAPGETIVRQGEAGDCMYVVLRGTVEVFREDGGSSTRIAELGPGEIFGEMALCEKQPRSATVRAVGEVRALTVDKRTFLRRVQEDPSLAFNVLRVLSSRIRTLDVEIARLRDQLDAARRDA